MEEEKRVVADVEARSESGQQETPFILQFLEVREGATSGTTTGTYPDVDASDTD